jgi:hypothetical protein
MEDELKKIIDWPGPLTLDQLKFIATQVLPLTSQLPSLYLQKLEERLRKDVFEKRKFYEKEYNISWSETLLDPFEVIKEQKLKPLPPAERLKRYLLAEARTEFAPKDIKLFEKFLKRKISYEEYENEVYILAQNTYCELKIV